MIRLSVIIVSLFYCLCSSASDEFVEADLWLPQRYQDHFGTLAKAAAIAQDDPYCNRLVSGRIIESRSTSDHLLFHFLCKSDNGKTFFIQVDGKTFAMTNPYGEKQRQLEMQRLEEERKAEEARKKAESDKLQAEEDQQRAEEEARLAQLRQEQSRYWGICRRAMKKRLKYFENVTVLTKTTPEPVIDAGEFTYLVDFDAENPAKKPLHYSISCVIASLDNYQVKVFPRKQ